MKPGAGVRNFFGSFGLMWSDELGAPSLPAIIPSSSTIMHNSTTTSIKEETACKFTWLKKSVSLKSQLDKKYFVTRSELQRKLHDLSKGKTDKHLFKIIYRYERGMLFLSFTSYLTFSMLNHY